MSASRPIIRSVLLVFMVLAGVSSAFAAAPTTRPVSFTITPEQCSAIESTITATGVWQDVVNTRTGRDGQKYVVLTSTARGTAVDEQGNTYRFNYHNHQHYAVPSDGSSFQVEMNDHFNLVGAGGTNDIHAGFAALLTFESEEDLATFNVSEFEFTNQRGYEGEGFPPCDPI